MSSFVIIVAALAVVWALLYHRAAATLWIVAMTAVLVVIARYTPWPTALVATLWVLVGLLLVLLAPTRLRSVMISKRLLQAARHMLPPLSQTEQEALEAGTVWWDGELLSGNPDWTKLDALPPEDLTDEERAFLEGPVEQLCEMLDEWRITRELHDLPPEAWAFIKRSGFLGMIIPKAYEGLGFSARAHSEVIAKLATRSATAAVSVMVPNSLGPAELLLHYGTQEQKDYYLPRLVRGEEMPCFALTNPEAGSDAASLPDFGVVCRDTWEGKPDVLGIRLTWEKRYITLAPIATLLGLAFRLYDPDRLIGPHAEIGITLALIPTNTPGVHIGRRHLPLNAAFMNGPTWGAKVFIPMKQVIGGVDQVGCGWRMLMNCLAAGRGISLPAHSCGVAKLTALVTGAYARVRRQFDLPIGRFEAVEAVLARIAGNTYLMEAVRRLTAQAVDAGEKPAVVSAIAKYHLTERVRAVINDAMDVHGGKAICMGPGNYLSSSYGQIPIGITVEGANILTRALIIFGQGLVRGHPYLLREIQAARDADEARALRDFDAALFDHCAFIASNGARALWAGLGGPRRVHSRANAHTRAYYRDLTRFSSALALAADGALFLLGGALKRRERSSARLGDVLSLLYIATAILRRYEGDGCPDDDLPLVHWAMRDTLARLEHAFHRLFENLPGRWVRRLLRGLVFPRMPGYGREFMPPGDRLDSEVAAILLEPAAAREHIVRGVFISRHSETDAVALLEQALRAAIAAEPVEEKLRRARRSGALTARPDAIVHAVAQGVISEAECELVKRAESLRRRAIMVDDFPADFSSATNYRTTQPVQFDVNIHNAA